MSPEPLLRRPPPKSEAPPPCNQPCAFRGTCAAGSHQRGIWALPLAQWSCQSGRCVRLQAALDRLPASVSGSRNSASLATRLCGVFACVCGGSGIAYSFQRSTFEIAVLAAPGTSAALSVGPRSL